VVFFKENGEFGRGDEVSQSKLCAPRGMLIACRLFSSCFGWELLHEGFIKI
jgi:hypothetical protein